MDCKVCQHDSQKRKEWGCDEDLQEVPESLHFACFYCVKDDADPNCHLCEGRGWWGPKRCPRTIVGHRENRVCESSVLLEYHLPSAGGWEDQAAKWHLAVALVSRERAGYEKQARDLDASKAKTGAK